MTFPPLKASGASSVRVVLRAALSPSRTSTLTGLATAFVLLFVGACRPADPVADRVLTEEEQAQFHAPLSLAAWDEAGSWPQFGHDPLHTGATDVELASRDLKLVWQFRPTKHVWSYREEYSAWSTPVVGTIGDRTLVIAGHYDRVVYAVDGATGQPAWTFRPGACVFASPALGHVQGRPMVFLAAINRSVYGLDAASGNKIWQFEAMPWSFTEAETFMSSPTLVRHGERIVLLVGVWIADRSAARNVQSGELIALDAADGSLIWRKRLASVRLTSPAVARLGGQTLVFVSAHHGSVWALDLADGSTLWQAVLNEETRSSPSIGLVDDVARLFVGTRFHSVFGLDPLSGARRWRHQTGYWIDATPSWVRWQGRTSLVVGSYDRAFYCLDGSSGQRQWHHTTGNFAYSSAAWARLGGRPVALAMSWDEHLYLLDGGSGQVLWKAASGPLIWSHANQGDSLWASPVVALVGGQPRVLAAALDGVLYAYGPSEPVQVTQRGTAARGTTADGTATRNGPSD